MSACSAGDSGSIPGPGRSPGEGNGSPLQHSCLENPMDRGAWQATVHGNYRREIAYRVRPLHYLLEKILKQNARRNGNASEQRGSRSENDNTPNERGAKRYHNVEHDRRRADPGSYMRTRRDTQKLRKSDLLIRSPGHGVFIYFNTVVQSVRLLSDYSTIVTFSFSFC